MVTKCGHCQTAEAPPFKFKACGRCRTIHYCSLECQKLSWKVHKLECISKTAQQITHSIKEYKSQLLKFQSLLGDEIQKRILHLSKIDPQAGLEMQEEYKRKLQGE